MLSGEFGSGHGLLNTFYTNTLNKNVVMYLVLFVRFSIG